MTDWETLDRDHVWHPFTQMQTAPTPLAVNRAAGVYLYTRDGRRVLDGISSWWVNIHGHSHPRLNAALARQAERLQQVIFAGCTHEGAARLAAELVRVTPPGLERVFYSDDGSTAVEVALKLALQYWQMRGENRSLYLALEGAYHGDTFGAMAAGGLSVFHETFRSLFCRVERAPAPHPLHFGGDEKICVSESLRVLEEKIVRHRDELAALILEPMLQGAGGMIVWPAEYLRGARELCNRYGILLIADEVLTGFGRTGKFFACEHGPIVPDILCLSKALTGGYMPLAVTMTTSEVYDAFLSSDPSKTFFHGHSFTANALSCAVALESLALFEEENRLGRVAEIESRFALELEELAELPRVIETRGIGGVAVIEIDTGGAGGYLDELGPKLRTEFLSRDILLRPLGNVLYFMPPYVISDEDIDRVFDAIGEVVEGLN